MPDYIYFLEELDAYNYRWQAVYPSMLAAARAAGLEGMYWAWLSQTKEGLQRRLALAGVVDLVEAERRSNASLERYRTMSLFSVMNRLELTPEDLGKSQEFEE